MPDPDQQPDFIVDPEGNNRDVRNQKYHPETGRPPIQVTRTTHSGSNPLGLIVFIISLIIFGGRLLISTSINRSRPTQPAGRFFFDRGNSYYEQKRFEDAITQFTTAINQSPEFGQAYNNRGLAYYDLAKFDQALADFSRACQLMPGSATPHSNQGAAYLALGRHAEALASLNKALELDARYGKAFYNRGLVYLDLANSNPDSGAKRMRQNSSEFYPPQLARNLI